MPQVVLTFACVHLPDFAAIDQSGAVHWNCHYYALPNVKVPWLVTIRW